MLGIVHTPLFPALDRQRWMDFFQFETSMVYTGQPGLHSKTPTSKTMNEQTNKQKRCFSFS